MTTQTIRADSDHRRASDSWSQLYAYRREAAARFGDVFSLPIAKRARDVLLAHTAAGNRVLEVGAGDRRMRRHLVDAHGEIDYESMDIDPEGDHDYHDLDEIPSRYDCVFAFEVIEHLALDEIRAWLPRLAALTKDGGCLLLSTPNTYYPPAYLRDVTHRTPLCYDELAGLVRAAGFQPERIYRIYNDPIHRILLRRYALGWLFSTIGIDFARQIVLVARREAEATRVSS